MADVTDAVQLQYRLRWDSDWQTMTVFRDELVEKRVKDDGGIPAGLHIQVARCEVPVTKDQARSVALDWLEAHAPLV